MQLPLSSPSPPAEIPPQRSDGTKPGAARRLLARGAPLDETLRVERPYPTQKHARRLANRFAPDAIERPPRRPPRRELGEVRHPGLLPQRHHHLLQPLGERFDGMPDGFEGREDVITHPLVVPVAVRSSPAIELGESAEADDVDVAIADSPGDLRAKLRRPDDDHAAADAASVPDGRELAGVFPEEADILGQAQLPFLSEVEMIPDPFTDHR